MPHLQLAEPLRFSLPEILLLLALTGASLGLFASRLAPIVRTILRARPDRNNPLRPLWPRIRVFVLEVLCQSKVIQQRPLPGIAHAFVFWGFLAFALVTLNHLLVGLRLGFLSHAGWVGTFYLGFAGVWAVLVAVSIAGLFIRRFLVRPRWLGAKVSVESGVIAGLIFILMVTYLAAFAVPSHGTAVTALWWTHTLALLLFLPLIPHTKHLHLVLSPLTVFLKNPQFSAIPKLRDDDTEPSSELESSKLKGHSAPASDNSDAPDVPEEDAGDIGLLTGRDLTQTIALQAYSCVECGRCTEHCPAATTGKLLNPKEITLGVRTYLNTFGPLSTEPILNELRSAPLSAVGEPSARSAREPSARSAREPSARSTREPVARSARDSFPLSSRSAAEGSASAPARNPLPPSAREASPLSAREPFPLSSRSAAEGSASAPAHLTPTNPSNDNPAANWLSMEAAFQCTTCGACEFQCPVGVQHLPILVGLRRSATNTGAYKDRHGTKLFLALEKQGNALGLPPSDRDKFIARAELPIFDGSQDYCLWLGCMGSFDPKGREIITDFARIMRHLGTTFGVLKKEKCTGDPARRLGNDLVFDSLAEQGSAALAKSKVRRLITICPHCVRTIAVDWATSGFAAQHDGSPIEIEHHSEFLARHAHLLPSSGSRHSERSEGPLYLAGASAEGTSPNPASLPNLSSQPDPPLTLSSRPERSEVERPASAPAQLPRQPDIIAYHDPCYLGRYRNTYDQPRAVVELAGELVEAERHRERSFCCGAGGGLAFLGDEPHADTGNPEAARISHVRAQELVATGAGTIATACPFCNTMFRDALTTITPAGTPPPQLLDIAQLTARALPLKSPQM